MISTPRNKLPKTSRTCSSLTRASPSVLVPFSFGRTIFLRAGLHAFFTVVGLSDAARDSRAAASRGYSPEAAGFVATGIAETGRVRTSGSVRRNRGKSRSKSMAGDARCASRIFAMIQGVSQESKMAAARLHVFYLTCSLREQTGTRERITRTYPHSEGER